MKLFQLLFTGVLLCLSITLSAANSDTRKAVLVTGANSGLGLKMTQALSQNGFHVYAGVLHQREMAEMNAMDNVTAVQFDVRNQDEIDAAAAFVKAQGRGLYGLINNAGVAVVGPLLETPVDQVQYQMDINVYGPLRVTQAFAPMIIESKGRIATTGSIAGIITRPAFGPYAMSKSAIEAYTDTLILEMARFGVSVHVIEPGAYSSNIGVTAVKLLDDANYWTEATQYPQERAAYYKLLSNFVNFPDPARVGEAALHLMQSDKPRPRYMVIEREEQADRVLRKQIKVLLELNDGQTHEFDRNRLVQMLDDEIAKRQGAK